MKEEKDLKSLSIKEASLPFVTGVFAGNSLSLRLVERGKYGLEYLLSGISPLIVLFSLGLLLYVKKLKGNLIKFIISFFFVFFALGFQCGFPINLEPYQYLEQYSSSEKPNSSNSVFSIRFISNSLKGFANQTKDKIDTIPFSAKSSSALIKALLTGDKSSLDKNIKEVFRKSGGAHILALSGLHLGIIYLILSFCTSFLGRFPISRIVRCFVIILCSGLYVIATGASPSIVRAFLFITFNELLKLNCRKTDAMNILCSALVIQIILCPSIISSLGFQLSYLAMTGIYTIFPIMKSWFRSNDINPMKKIWDAASLSISCQIFTGPLVWLRFNSFPQYFLLTNILALPFVGIIMVLSIVLIVLSFCNCYPPLLIHIDETLINLLLSILNIISQL